MVSLSLILAGAYAAHLYYYLNLIFGDDLCNWQKLIDSEAQDRMRNHYNLAQCFVEFFITVWLIVASCLTIRLLGKNIDESFKREKCRIYFILTTYTVFYSILFSYHSYLYVTDGINAPHFL